MSEGTRLNKFLASCGVGSRRACDELISSGRVEINGSPCTNLGTRVLPSDHVRVDGRRVRQEKPTVLVMNKPRGFVCSKQDELNRETIYDLLPERFRTLHHVGRLDRESEGLLVLTNDGNLSQRLMHPSMGVEKEYLVTADQAFQNAHLDQFLEGIYTPDGKLRAKHIERLSPRRIRIVLEHGAKRQIRVMFDAMGYQVTKLLRIRIGGLWLGDLESGHCALLKAEEIRMLLGSAAVETPKKPVRKPRAMAAKKAPAAKRRAAATKSAPRAVKRAKRA